MSDSVSYFISFSEKLNLFCAEASAGLSGLWLGRLAVAGYCAAEAEYQYSSVISVMAQ